ncbi:MAG: arginine deiminase family protein [Kiloniellales bacterium]|nr:arginine deiminase family protein [Kiloniellales bacterium]
MRCFNEYAHLKKVGLRTPEAAFRSEARIAAQWRELGWRGAPDFKAAVREYDSFVTALAGSGAEPVFLPEAEGLTLDAIYVRDSAIATKQGMMLCRMGKTARRSEPAAVAEGLGAAGVSIAGRVENPGLLEGGDFVWLDDQTCVVGLTYRTDTEGVWQLKGHLGDGTEHMILVDLPHYKGPDDVFHLMSILSPLDRDLALVFSPLMPISFRRKLQDRGIELVEAAEEEFETKGCNVLALGPRLCLAVDGNPQTRRRLEAAGCEVLVYEGREITQKGDGGPTCLTLPLERDNA